jgi:hypothetical protein
MVRTHTLFGIFFAGVVIFPSVASAQFVPVKDETLIQAFQSYASSFDDFSSSFNDTFNTPGGNGNSITNGTTDSIRDLIAGSNPGGIAAQPCKADDASDWIWGPSRTGDEQNPDAIYTHSAKAWNSTSSPWMAAIDYARRRNIDELPSVIPDDRPGYKPGEKFGHTIPQVNASRSLRCLLQELVEWKKLDLSIQVHSLLKQYITDAQMKQLANQAQSRAVAAGVKFASEGRCVTYPDGREECSPLILTNDILNDEDNRIGQNMVEMITASAGDPNGTANIPEIFKDSAVAQIVDESNAASADPYQSIGSNPCNMTDPNTGFFQSEQTYLDFMKNPMSARDPLNRPVSPLFGFLGLVDNPKCTRLGAIDSISEDYQEVRTLSRQTIERDARNGVLPSIQNRGQRSLYIQGIPTQIGAANAELFNAPRQNALDQLNNCTADSCPAKSTRESAVNANNLLGSSVQADLATTSNAVHDIVKELYDTMWFGYFDLHPYTAEWAQATMLSIYDMMKFSDEGPAIVTSNLPPSGNDGDSEIPEEFAP